LENVIAPNKNGIEFRINFDSHKFTRKFIDTLVKDAEDEYEKPEWAHRQEQNDIQKIIDEISNDKTTLGISLEEILQWSFNRSTYLQDKCADCELYDKKMSNKRSQRRSLTKT
jgi:hypothetical protein